MELTNYIKDLIYKKSYILGVYKRWWPISESNQGHTDFQSVALPTELIGHGSFCNNL